MVYVTLCGRHDHILFAVQYIEWCYTIVLSSVVNVIVTTVTSRAYSRIHTKLLGPAGSQPHIRCFKPSFRMMTQARRESRLADTFVGKQTTVAPCTPRHVHCVQTRLRTCLRSPPPRQQGYSNRIAVHGPVYALPPHHQHLPNKRMFTIRVLIHQSEQTNRYVKN